MWGLLSAELSLSNLISGPFPNRAEAQPHVQINAYDSTMYQRTQEKKDSLALSHLCGGQDLKRSTVFYHWEQQGSRKKDGAKGKTQWISLIIHSNAMYQFRLRIGAIWHKEFTMPKAPPLPPSPIVSWGMERYIHADLPWGLLDHALLLAQQDQLLPANRNNHIKTAS